MVQDNRTFVCSVLFLDIVAYSENPVADQLRLKQRLNSLLGTALRNVAINDRIVLDTGDGAAVSFLGNPEAALFVAIELRDALNLDDPCEFEVRFGINLGPVRMITDINRQTNIIGNGINVAQRVMGFATPGQILVSRSYFEVVACLSSDYAQLFSYSGSHTDKHVHDHEIYMVGATNPDMLHAALEQPVESSSDGLDLGNLGNLGKRVTFEWERAQEKLQKLQAQVQGRWRVVLPLSLMLVVSSIIGVRAALHEPSGAAEEEFSQEIVQETGQESGEPLTLADNVDSVDDNTAGQSIADSESSSQPQPVAAVARASNDLQQDADNASIRIRITPWGEAFVDGNKEGVCSPICEFNVPPGTRRIEARNPSATARQEIITLESGEQRTIDFRF